MFGCECMTDVTNMNANALLRARLRLFQTPVHTNNSGPWITMSACRPLHSMSIDSLNSCFCIISIHKLFCFNEITGHLRQRERVRARTRFRENLTLSVTHDVNSCSFPTLQMRLAFEARGSLIRCCMTMVLWQSSFGVLLKWCDWVSSNSAVNFCHFVTRTKLILQWHSATMPLPSCPSSVTIFKAGMWVNLTLFEMGRHFDGTGLFTAIHSFADACRLKPSF